MLASREISSHFLDSGKLRGISGSFCDSHPTIPDSRLDSGSFAGARPSFLLLDVRLVAIRDRRLLVLTLLAVVVVRRISSDVRGPALIDAMVYEPVRACSCQPATGRTHMLSSQITQVSLIHLFDIVMFCIWVPSCPLRLWLFLGLLSIGLVRGRFCVCACLFTYSLLKILLGSHSQVEIAVSAWLIRRPRSAQGGVGREVARMSKRVV